MFFTTIFIIAIKYLSSSRPIFCLYLLNKSAAILEPLNFVVFFPTPRKGFSNRDIAISYLYMNAPLNFFNELSMSKR